MAKKKTKLELYIEQREQLFEKLRKTREELEQVANKLAKAKAKFEELAADQAMNGNDHSKELDKLDDEIHALMKKQRQLEAGKKALEHGAIPGRIKGEELVEEWNKEIKVKLFNEVVLPKLEKVRELKYLYSKAVLEAHEALNQLKAERSKYLSQFGTGFGSWKFHDVSFRDKDIAEKYFLVDKDIRAIYGPNPKMPDSLKDYKPEGEDE